MLLLSGLQTLTWVRCPTCPCIGWPDLRPISKYLENPSDKIKGNGHQTCTVGCAWEPLIVPWKMRTFLTISVKFHSNFRYYPLYTKKYPSKLRSCRQVSLNFCTKLRKSTDTPKVPYKPKMLYTLKVLYTPKVLTHQECYTQYTSKEPYKPNVRDKPKLPGNPVPRVHLLCTPDGNNWYDTIFSWMVSLISGL